MQLDARTAPIHAVLEKFLSPSDLAYALRLWSEKYVGQPELSLKDYIDSFYDRQPLSVRSYELYNHLLPALMVSFKARTQFKGELIEPYDFPDYDLEIAKQAEETEATEQLESETNAAQLVEAPVTPDITELLAMPSEEVEASDTLQPRYRIERFEVFSFFIRTLSDLIPADKRNKLFKANEETLKSCCIFPVGETFYLWLMSESGYFEDEHLERHEMSNIVNVLYMGMCEYLGPVHADSILNQASSATAEQFPHATLEVDNLL
ncbi:hypothetical protein EOL70_15220 [Leucothrix sargassi]|nr:hypothetical protein EOL70_15220 [Leucothrix sargassi]